MIDDRDIILVDVFPKDELRLKKFGNIDDGGDDNDGNDVHENPGGDAPPSQGLSVVERMTDSRVPEHYHCDVLQQNCN